MEQIGMEKGDVLNFLGLFRGRESAYGRYNPTIKDKKKRGKTVHAHLSYTLWENHLKGVGPYLGVIPIREDGTCYFGAIDWDDHEANHEALCEAVERLKLPLVVCRSKSGGAHLYALSHEPIPASLMVQRLDEFKSLLGLQNPDNRPIEIFPKQKKNYPGSTGNWINLPYYHADDTDRYAVVAGVKLSLHEFLEYGDEKAVTLRTFKSFTLKGNASTLNDEAPPCLQLIDIKGPDAEEKGNTFLFNLGVLWRMEFPDDWQRLIEGYNAKLTDPMSAGAIEDLIHSVGEKTYAYQCETPPLLTHCNRAACRKRKFGVGNFGTMAGSPFAIPELTHLRKIQTDPPLWQIDVNGRIVTIPTETLLNVRRFQKTVMESHDLLFPVFKAEVWQDRIRNLLTELAQITAPEDAGIIGQFEHVVRLFLLRYKKADGREAILKGAPWLDTEDSKIYFKSSDLMEYLADAKFKDYNKAQVWNTLVSKGAETTQLRIADRTTRVWAIPVEYLEEQGRDFTDRVKDGAEHF